MINKPADLGVLARLEHLPELVDKARAVNHRLLMIERADQDCAIGSSSYITEARLSPPLHNNLSQIKSPRPEVI